MYGEREREREREKGMCGSFERLRLEDILSALAIYNRWPQGTLPHNLCRVVSHVATRKGYMNDLQSDRTNQNPMVMKYLFNRETLKHV